MDQLQKLFGGHKTFAALLTETGFEPVQIRACRRVAMGLV
jgi:hypothetical protein